MENRDVSNLCWQAVLQQDKGQPCTLSDNQGDGKGLQDQRRHQYAGLSVDAILKCSAMRRSCDNITTVIITFDNFYQKLDEYKRIGVKQAETEILQIIDFKPIDENVTQNTQMFIEDVTEEPAIQQQIRNESPTIFGETGAPSDLLPKSETVPISGTQQDVYLSEIAEEDTVSMVSDKRANRLREGSRTASAKTRKSLTSNQGLKQ